ncbi:MAG: MFS transporter [Thermodesulfobacteriota bacterium]|nr:MAG: MFS transporter [Thermodesulfobacteriota bacterium]
MVHTNTLTNQTGYNFYFHVSVLIASMGGFLFGYDTAVISGAILFIKKQFVVSPFLEGVIISSLFLSAMIGAPLGGTIADKIGRRKTLIITGLFFLVGSLIMASAPTIPILILGRVIAGLSLGAVSIISPLYISELSTSSNRGKMVTFNILGIAFGALLAYIVNYVFSHDGDWRWMFGLEALPAFCLIVGMIFLSETPRWLAIHSLEDKAKRVLQHIRGNQDINEELRAIESNIGKHGGGWSELLHPTVRRVVLLGVGLAFCRGLAGASIILYGYSPTILELSGFKIASLAILATVGIGIVNTIMTFVAIALVDKVGRRPLMVVGLIGITISLVAIGITFMFDGASAYVKWVTIGSLLLYVGSWSLGPRPIFWILISEIYPTKVRARGMSLGSLTKWGTNWLATLTFLPLIGLIGKTGTFWFYGFFSILTLLLFYFMIPETNGQSLEKIEDHWQSSKGAEEMGK